MRGNWTGLKESELFWTNLQKIFRRSFFKIIKANIGLSSSKDSTNLSAAMLSSLTKGATEIIGHFLSKLYLRYKLIPLKMTLTLGPCP